MQDRNCREHTLFQDQRSTVLAHGTHRPCKGVTSMAKAEMCQPKHGTPVKVKNLFITSVSISLPRSVCSLEQLSVVRGGQRT